MTTENAITAVIVADLDRGLVVEITTDAARLPVPEVGLVAKTRNIRSDDRWSVAIHQR